MNLTCIFGGSFNPFHSGHEEILQNLLDANLFSKIIISPSFANPLKAAYETDTNARISAVKNAILKLESKQDFNPNAILELSTWEVENKNYKTIDFVRHLQKTYPNLCLAIGADILHQIHLWDESNALLESVSFAVFARPNYDLTPPPNMKILRIFHTNNPVSSTAIRAKHTEV